VAGVRDLGAVVAQGRGLHFLVEQVLEGPLALEFERWLNKVERRYRAALRPYRTKVSRGAARGAEGQ
jgi:hypothetical protein